MKNEKVLNTIEEAIEDFRQGKIVIVVDDEDRENEGDFIIAAEKVTPEIVNFMLKNGRGVLCAPLSEERCAQLELNMMEPNNTSLLGTPFTVTVDLLGEGCTTGVSIHDRAATLRALADPKTKPSDLGRPGHIKPLSAPSSAPISIARAVPMPCAADPSANPCAIGSVTPQRRSSQGPTRLPKIPTQKTTTEVIVMMPPSGSATDTAIGTVTDFGASEVCKIRSAPSIRAR